MTILRSLPHGHVAAVHAMAVKLGLPALLGPACGERDLALALIISRVVAPASKLSTLTWWDDTTLGADLGTAAGGLRPHLRGDGLAGVPTGRDRGETRPPPPGPRRPARRRWRCSTCPRPGWKDATARWPPAATPRDGKKGKLQIEYGLLTEDQAGHPVAVRVFPGNTGDPGAFTAIVTVVRDKFGLAKMVMAGDRGMITSAQIQAMNQLDDGTQRPDAYEWIAALRAPAIRKLMAGDGPLQLSLSGQQDLAEITSEDFPGERLIACRNPVLAADRARTREELLAATGKLLAPLHRPGPGRPPAGRRRDRGQGRQGDHQVQDRQALHRRHHRPPP